MCQNLLKCVLLTFVQFMLKMGYFSISIKQSLCVHGTGDGTQCCLHARQAFSHCATFVAQINKAVFKKMTSETYDIASTTVAE